MTCLSSGRHSVTKKRLSSHMLSIGNHMLSMSSHTLSTGLTLGKIFKHPTRVASYYFVFVLQPAHKFLPQSRRIEPAGKPAVVAELAPVAAIDHGENYTPQTLSLGRLEVELPEQANQVSFGITRSECPFIFFEKLDHLLHPAEFAKISRVLSAEFLDELIQHCYQSSKEGIEEAFSGDAVFPLRPLPTRLRERLFHSLLSQI
jgi:hypothetical protein